MDQAATHTMLITMAAAISVGVILIILAHRLRVSAIVLLLFGGILLGPQVTNIVRPESLGDALSVIVSLAVALILFEGGLTLDVKGYRSGSSAIRLLLSVGVMVTWLATASGIMLIFGYSVSFALLAASLVIVTGPTVIAPLLKRIKVTPKLHSILHWEGVLIDPIGVFIAVLCFEYVGGKTGGEALAGFGVRMAIGLTMGAAGGLGIYHLIRVRFVPAEMMNLFTLAGAVLIFGLTETLGHWLHFSEAGLLAVVVAGFILGFKQPDELKSIRHFKAEITDLMIGMLFILLAARLEFGQFRAFGLPGLLLVLFVMLVVRPLNILSSTLGSGFTWRERAFLSWVAPRGIVSASMASLFTLRLIETGVPNAEFIETFTYSIIISTVILQGFSAGYVARLLGLQAEKPTGWLIIGAHPFGRRIARFIRARAGLQTVLLDQNPKRVREADSEGIPAIRGDGRDPTVLDRHPELQGIGNILALTSNEDLNELICQRWSEAVGDRHLFRWRPARSRDKTEVETTPGRVVWSSLPYPSLLSAELMRGEATMTQTSRPLHGPRGLMQPVAAIVGGVLVLDPDGAVGIDREKAGETLYLRREADYLLRSIYPDLFMELDTRSPNEMFAEILKRVVELVPRIPADKTRSELIEREQAYPTALGHGIAVPHAYVAELESRMCAIARLPDGIDFGAQDGEPVRLVFLLLSPAGDPEGHLATLAEIARLASDPVTREWLIDAKDPGRLIDVIRNFDPTARPVEDPLPPPEGEPAGN